MITMRNRLLLLAALVLTVLTVPARAQAPQAFAVLTSTTCPGSGCVQVPVGGLGHVGIQLNGTWVATAQFKGSIDGANFVALSMVPSNSITTATSATANGVWNANVGGYQVIQVSLSAFTSGAVVVNLQGAP